MSEKKINELQAVQTELAEMQEDVRKVVKALKGIVTMLGLESINLAELSMETAFCFLPDIIFKLQSGTVNFDELKLSETMEVLNKYKHLVD